MPYTASNVPKDKAKQWAAVWTSAYERAKKNGKSDKDAEASAFAQANAVAGPSSSKATQENWKAIRNPNSKFIYEGVSEGMRAATSAPPGGKMSKSVNYVPVSDQDDQCQFCIFYQANAVCSNIVVSQDEMVPENADGLKIVSATGWCDEFESRITQIENLGAGGDLHGPGKVAGMQFRKFIPFVKVDAQKREVWGIVTAEVPDKDYEVCDYAKSKPYYEEVIAEMGKATDGGNFMPLREMHRAVVAGKGIGYEFRDADREIFMGFKVTTDQAWKQVEEKVYTGFSQGGSYVGDLVPDPVFKNCMRYVSKPAEVSLVDNPCLGVAHFTYVSKTGEVELRKNRCVVDDTPTRISVLEREVALVKLVLRSANKGPQIVDLNLFKVKTKRVADEDLPASAFLIVGDKEKPETWQKPLKFSDDKKTKSYIRSALVRINEVPPTEQKKLLAIAEQYGIDASSESNKFAAIRSYLRKAMRQRVNKIARTGDPGHALAFLDNELGKLAKGMSELSCLAQCVDHLAYMLYSVIAEQEYEEDKESVLPAMLEGNLNDLLDSLVEMCSEETAEMREQVARAGG